MPQKADVFVLDDDKLKAKPATVKKPMIIDEEAALQTLEMFQHGSYGLQSDKAVSDNVAQHRLNTSSSLSDEPWLGTKEEELDS